MIIAVKFGEISGLGGDIIWRQLLRDRQQSRKLTLEYNMLMWALVWFDSLRPINNLSVKQGRVFLGWTSAKLG